MHLPTEKIRQIICLTAKGDSVRTIARQLEIDKDTVNRVILRASDHCTHILTDLLISLEMTETQVNELWAFVKKRKILGRRRTSHKNKIESGTE
jgi:IS30 family transposase